MSTNDKFASHTDKSPKLKVPRDIRKQFDQPRALTLWRMLWRQGQIAFGALVAALGFTLFQMPFKLAAGGVTGLGILLNHFTGFPVGMTILVLNIPLLLLGFFRLGRWQFLVSTVTAVLCLSFGTDFFNLYLPGISETWPITDDLLLASIYAGVLFGIGVGIIYRAGGTIGGTSIPARIIYEHTGLPMSQSYLYTDGAVILAAGFFFNWEVAMLATLTLVLCGIIADFILEGVSHVRTATIVTKRPEDVRWAILYQLKRGVSLWTIEGGYQQSPRTMVFCTVLRSRVTDLKSTRSPQSIQMLSSSSARPSKS